MAWFFIVSTETPEQRDAAGLSEKTLASWEASVTGILWLKDLVADSKAVQLLDAGFPSRFTAAARDVLPFLESGAPADGGLAVQGTDCHTPAGWLWKARIDRDKIARCAPDQQLTIDAWDQL